MPDFIDPCSAYINDPLQPMSCPEEGVVSPESGPINRNIFLPVQNTNVSVSVIVIPASTAPVGPTDNFDSAKRGQHVQVSSFAIDIYQVGRDKFMKVMGRNSDDSQPVLFNALDAQEYCRRLEGRLPSEPEWELAVRGPNAKELTLACDRKNFEIISTYQNSFNTDKLCGFGLKLGLPEFTGGLYHLQPGDYDYANAINDGAQYLYLASRGVKTTDECQKLEAPIKENNLKDIPFRDEDICLRLGSPAYSNSWVADPIYNQFSLQEYSFRCVYLADPQEQVSK